MRRRERWQNLAWLNWMDGDDLSGRVNVPETATGGIAPNLESLITRYRRCVEVSRDGDLYTVQVLPMSTLPSDDFLQLGLKYVGRDLGAILATADVELELLAAGKVVHRITSTPRERWVLC